MLLMTIILMDLLAGMEFDLFVPSFPELQNHFTLSPFLVETLLSVNFIGYCLGLFFVGELADRFGRKPIILLGLVAFIIGSMLCLWAASYQYLLLGRFLQGIGISAPAILSFLIIADTYSLKKQQFLMAMLNGTSNASTAAAPVIGSYITLYFHWQGNFIVLLILGLAILLATLFFIPNYHLNHPISKLPRQKEISFLQGYISLFHSKPLMLLIITLLFIFVPYWIFVGMSPLLYIKDLGVSLSHFGYYQGILALIFALGSILFGLMLKYNEFNQKKMLYISIYIFVASIFIISSLSLFNSANPLFITLALLLFVIGQIIPSTLLYPLCLNFIYRTPKDEYQRSSREEN